MEKYSLKKMSTTLSILMILLHSSRTDFDLQDMIILVIFFREVLPRTYQSRLIPIPSTYVSKLDVGSDFVNER